MDPLLGEIKLFAGSFAPQGWYTCEGQTLSISQNTALFSILGTTYGGDGMTTFKLPDLRGAFPTQCTNLSGFHPGGTYTFGQTGGAQNATITAINLPPHTHTIIKGPGTNLQGTVTVTTTMNVSPNPANTGTPGTTTVLAQTVDSGSGAAEYMNTATTGLINNTAMLASATSNTLNFDPTGLTMTPYGSGPNPIPTVPNFVAMQYIIAYEGIYPSRP